MVRKLNIKINLLCYVKGLPNVQGGKSRVDVAIALNLETFEIISLFHDYLKLSDIYKLVTVYDYLGSDFSIFLDLSIG